MFLVLRNSQIFVRGFCAKRDIPYEEIRIVVRPEYDEKGTLRAVDTDIQLPPAFPEKYRETLVRVVEQYSVKRPFERNRAFGFMLRHSWSFKAVAGDNGHHRNHEERPSSASALAWLSPKQELNATPEHCGGAKYSEHLESTCSIPE